MSDNVVEIHCAPEGGRPHAVAVRNQPARYAHTRWRLPEGTGAFLAFIGGVVVGFMFLMFAPPTLNSCLDQWGRAPFVQGEGP